MLYRNCNNTKLTRKKGYSELGFCDCEWGWGCFGMKRIEGLTRFFGLGLGASLELQKLKKILENKIARLEEEEDQLMNSLTWSPQAA